MYSGNEATRFTITRTLGTSLLTVTKAGQMTLEQAKTVLSTGRTLSQATKVRLRYKRVDFLGTAKHIAIADMVIFIAYRAIATCRYRRATMTGQMTLEQTKTVLLTSQILSQATVARL